MFIVIFSYNYKKFLLGFRTADESLRISYIRSKHFLIRQVEKSLKISMLTRLKYEDKSENKK